MFDKHYVGLDLTRFENNGKTRPVSRVTLNVDDETVLTAGDDSGLELKSDCPHATQAMVNAILASVRGYRYQMYKADAINIDPAAEPGDGITANGVYSVISRMDDDGGGYPDVSAPGDGEMEDEFPTFGPLTQAFNRKIAAAKSQILKLADEIRLVVEDVGNVRAELSLKVGRDENNQIVSMLNASADQINIKGNRFVLDSTNFKVSANGTIEAKKGVFEEVTISGSTFGGTLNNVGGSLNGVTGTLEGVTGSYLGSINSGGTFKGGLSNATGSFYGGHYSGMVSSCNLGNTSLATGNGNAYFSNNGAGIAMSYGSLSSILSNGTYYIAAQSNGGYCSGPFNARGGVSGASLNSEIATVSYGTRNIPSIGSAISTISDFGSATLNGDGQCYITIDPVFSETVNKECIPIVFITKYGEGDIWVENVTPDIILICGTPNLSFSWEARYQQTNTPQIRLLNSEFTGIDHSSNGYAQEAAFWIEHHSIDYERQAYEMLDLQKATATDYAKQGFDTYTQSIGGKV